MPVLRNRVSRFLHPESFTLEPAIKQALKRGIVDDRLHAIFALNQHSLGARPRVKTINPRRWKVLDAKKAYLIKDVGDHLVVMREALPGVCSIIEFFAFEAKPKYYTARWRAQQMRLQFSWIMRKRRETPRKLLVNIGAGSWYVPDWKVLEYRGPWYSYYMPGFIDYAHDLTSDGSFPLADGSAHLFYSEHVIEHLKDEWCRHLFSEVFRCLEPGGGFRLVMPDADLIYDRFLKRDAEFFKSWMDRDNDTLEEAFCTLIGKGRDPAEVDFAQVLSRMEKHDFLDWCREGLEYDRNRAGEHINWFNFEKLSTMLKAAGFCNTRLSKAQESQFKEMRGPKFDTRPSYSLHVECVKKVV